MRPKSTAWIVVVGLVASSLLALTAPASAQDEWDYGDAPEDALAYPSFGGMGFFPTCRGGTNTQVIHGLGWAHFLSAGPQPGWDFESDGNAGVCVFPTYDDDECYADGDAGLLVPTSYTILNGTVVPCPLVITQVPLGTTCQMATIQANIVNNMPVVGFVNLVCDWDQSGTWGGSSMCGATPVPEHAVVDDPIPIGFSGLWTSPPFMIGAPGAVYVWMRLEIAEQAVGPGWDGSGGFEDGESEDYLVYVKLPGTPLEEQTWGRVKSMYR